jgi:hypothetical protein
LFNGRGQAAQELLGEDIMVPENVRNHSPNDNHFSEILIFNTAVRMSVLHCPETFLTNILSCSSQKVKCETQSVVKRQAMYTYRNMEKRSRNHCRSVKEIIITYFVFVCL